MPNRAARASSGDPRLYGFGYRSRACGDPGRDRHQNDNADRAEARFQWLRALNFGADEALASVIERKLKGGLPERQSRTVDAAGAARDAES